MIGEYCSKNRTMIIAINSNLEFNEYLQVFITIIKITMTHSHGAGGTINKNDHGEAVDAII